MGMRGEKKKKKEQDLGGKEINKTKTKEESVKQKYLRD